MQYLKLARKYKEDGCPHGPLDIPSVVENAYNLINNFGKESIMVIVACSLPHLTCKGYFPPYLNHRKLAIFFADACIDNYQLISY